jgi:hypothetical protein
MTAPRGEGFEAAERFQREKRGESPANASSEKAVEALGTGLWAGLYVDSWEVAFLQPPDSWIEASHHRLWKKPVFHFLLVESFGVVPRETVVSSCSPVEDLRRQRYSVSIDHLGLKAVKS